MRLESMSRMLERGVAVGDVAELVGDTERTLLKHYGKWVTSRQARLSAILQDAFADRPKGNVIAIRG